MRLCHTLCYWRWLWFLYMQSYVDQRYQFGSMTMNWVAYLWRTFWSELIHCHLRRVLFTNCGTLLVLAWRLILARIRIFTLFLLLYHSIYLKDIIIMLAYAPDVYRWFCHSYQRDLSDRVNCFNGGMHLKQRRFD